jgi:hypothetical protein
MVIRASWPEFFMSLLMMNDYQRVCGDTCYPVVD